jgi:hypothetical protein
MMATVMLVETFEEQFGMHPTLRWRVALSPAGRPVAASSLTLTFLVIRYHVCSVGIAVVTFAESSS